MQIRMKQNVAVLVFLLILLIGCRQKSKYVNTEKLDMNQLIKKLEDLTNSRKFDEASHLIQSVDVDNFFRDTIIDKTTGKASSEQIVFLAYAQELILIPGVPNSLKIKLLNNRDFKMIPGTGDTISIYDDKLWTRWFEAVSNFALKFNSRMYKAGIELKKFERPAKSPDKVRSYLNIDKATWNQLPIEVRVIFENRVNEVFSRYRELEKSPSTPQHRH